MWYIGYNKDMALVSTHSRLKAAGEMKEMAQCYDFVSTHSRLKAAGGAGKKDPRNQPCFNTQPPKGGWFVK